MKFNFTRPGFFLLLILLTATLKAQFSNDYTLHLRTGSYLPQVNANSLSRADEMFSRSSFNGKHYLVIQFNSLPSFQERTALQSAGIVLMDYIPNLAYTAVINGQPDLGRLNSAGARSIMTFTAAQKGTADVLSGPVLPHAVKQNGFADINILTYENLSASSITQAINRLGGTIVEEIPVFRMMTVRIPQSKRMELAALPFVQWIDFIDPPNLPENLLGRSLHRVSVLQDGVRNLKGDGMNIGIWDELCSPHLDFSPTGRLTQMESGSPGSHGTHVSGTVGGKGIINPIARGMAPNASIFSYNGFNNDVQVEMATAIPANTLISSNHSYHDGLGVQCGVTGNSVAYTLRSRNTDLNLNNFPYHIHCHSAGNNQGDCTGGWGTITGTGKSAKNNLVVGSISTAEALSSFSSCGPVHDGRIKPEIVAMGSNVFSTYTPLNTYNTISGTSMSTPGITGTVAVLAQRYKQLNGNVNPPSHLIKNIACNAATDLGTAGPDYRFGFGRVDALKSVKILENNTYALNTVATGASNDLTITVPAGAARLKVMLTWNDPAATANASFALINNLDLRVIEGANTTLPWILDRMNPANAATRADDNISNIEQVTIDNPAAGTYTLRVTGEAITTGPNQAYAISWIIDMPGIEVVYPNGNESFSPGSSETITWNNAGVSGNQTVEYSLDNGGTWTTISTVSATTTRLTWTVPAAFTSTALIRVTNGSLTDVSDNGFKILGTVTGFTGNNTTCNAGEINFSWNAVTNANAYDIYSLDNTGNFVLLSSNISGTSFTATGLTPGANMWFTIRAKNTTNNAESERAIAINVVASTGGGGIGNAGPISGSAGICGNPSAVSYSISAVPGATTYTWTSPPGSIIVSGQGSTSITVNYPGGSTNGNITVTAGNGSCSSAPASLAITINPLPAAPAGGGNQSQTVCLPDPIPVLTATATVPAGHTVRWYNAASGGTIVSSPTLNAAGTITYYAASLHTASGCESNSRTAVTLSITTVAQAAVSTSGATTFCQGGSVTLTASSGSSYNWSNGAISQSILVNANGNYSVTVTTAGCTSTSPAVNVLVNPIPAAAITASGPLSFCQGNNVTLTATTNGASYSWSNGANTQSIIAGSSGNYTVTVTSAAGCSATSAATVVSVSPNPVVNISAAPYTRLYPGLSTTLTANVNPAGNYNYTWYRDNIPVPGAVSSTLPGIDPNKLGSYTVTVTNSSGLPCSNTSAALLISDSAVNKLFILPNPNNGKFDVLYHNIGTNTYTLKIYDSKGAYVFEKSYTLSAPYQRMEVNLRNAGRKGIYHIVLAGSGRNKLATGKVLIQ